MNHAWDGALANSAVPVFPAMGTVAAAALLPVPRVTTSRMYLPSVFAASALSTTAAGDWRALFSSMSQRPWGMEPAFATVAATRAIWNGDATTSPCPYADCPSDFFNSAAESGDAL